jgi:hypothetical protein
MAERKGKYAGASDARISFGCTNVIVEVKCDAIAFMHRIFPYRIFPPT